ncbi:hypothetical protein AB0H93_43555, partial [Saccharopolyspora sp. NPDC050642]
MSVAADPDLRMYAGLLGDPEALPAKLRAYAAKPKKDLRIANAGITSFMWLNTILGGRVNQLALTGEYGPETLLGLYELLLRQPRQGDRAREIASVVAELLGVQPDPGSWNPRDWFGLSKGRGLPATRGEKTAAENVEEKTAAANLDEKTAAEVLDEKSAAEVLHEKTRPDDPDDLDSDERALLAEESDAASIVSAVSDGSDRTDTTSLAEIEDNDTGQVREIPLEFVDPMLGMGGSVDALWSGGADPQVETFIETLATAVADTPTVESHSDDKKARLAGYLERQRILDMDAVGRLGEYVRGLVDRILLAEVHSAGLDTRTRWVADGLRARAEQNNLPGGAPPEAGAGPSLAAEDQRLFDAITASWPSSHVRGSSPDDQPRSDVALDYTLAGFRDMFDGFDKALVLQAKALGPERNDRAGGPGMPNYPLAYLGDGLVAMRRVGQLLYGSNLDGVRALVFAPNTRKGFVLVRRGNDVHIFGMHDGQAARPGDLDGAGRLFGVAYMPDGRLLFGPQVALRDQQISQLAEEYANIPPTVDADPLATLSLTMMEDVQAAVGNLPADAAKRWTLTPISIGRGPGAFSQVRDLLRLRGQGATAVLVDPAGHQAFTMRVDDSDVAVLRHHNGMSDDMTGSDARIGADKFVYAIAMDADGSALLGDQAVATVSEDRAARFEELRSELPKPAHFGLFRYGDARRFVKSGAAELALVREDEIRQARIGKKRAEPGGEPPQLGQSMWTAPVVMGGTLNGVIEAVRADEGGAATAIVLDGESREAYIVERQPGGANNVAVWLADGNPVPVDPAILGNLRRILVVGKRSDGSVFPPGSFTEPARRRFDEELLRQARSGLTWDTWREVRKAVRQEVDGPSALEQGITGNDLTFVAANEVRKDPARKPSEVVQRWADDLGIGRQQRDGAASGAKSRAMPSPAWTPQRVVSVGKAAAMPVRALRQISAPLAQDLMQLAEEIVDNVHHFTGAYKRPDIHRNGLDLPPELRSVKLDEQLKNKPPNLHLKAPLVHLAAQHLIELGIDAASIRDIRNSSQAIGRQLGTARPTAAPLSWPDTNRGRLYEVSERELRRALAHPHMRPDSLVPGAFLTDVLNEAKRLPSDETSTTGREAPPSAAQAAPPAVTPAARYAGQSGEQAIEGALGRLRERWHSARSTPVPPPVPSPPFAPSLFPGDVGEFSISDALEVIEALDTSASFGMPGAEPAGPVRRIPPVQPDDKDYEVALGILYELREHDEPDLEIPAYRLALDAIAWRLKNEPDESVVRGDAMDIIAALETREPLDVTGGSGTLRSIQDILDAAAELEVDSSIAQSARLLFEEIDLRDPDDLDFVNEAESAITLIAAEAKLVEDSEALVRYAEGLSRITRSVRPEWVLRRKYPHLFQDDGPPAATTEPDPDVAAAQVSEYPAVEVDDPGSPRPSGEQAGAEPQGPQAKRPRLESPPAAGRESLQPEPSGSGSERPSRVRRIPLATADDAEVPAALDILRDVSNFEGLKRDVLRYPEALSAVVWLLHIDADRDQVKQDAEKVVAGMGMSRDGSRSYTMRTSSGAVVQTVEDMTTLAASMEFDAAAMQEARRIFDEVDIRGVGDDHDLSDYDAESLAAIALIADSVTMRQRTNAVLLSQISGTLRPESALEHRFRPGLGGGAITPENAPGRTNVRQTVDEVLAELREDINTNLEAAEVALRELPGRDDLVAEAMEVLAESAPLLSDEQREWLAPLVAADRMDPATRDETTEQVSAWFGQESDLRVDDVLAELREAIETNLEAAEVALRELPGRDDLVAEAMEVLAESAPLLSDEQREWLAPLVAADLMDPETRDKTTEQVRASFGQESDLRAAWPEERLKAEAAIRQPPSEEALRSADKLIAAAFDTGEISDADRRDEELARAIRTMIATATSSGGWAAGLQVADEIAADRGSMALEWTQDRLDVEGYVASRALDELGDPEYVARLREQALDLALSSINPLPKISGFPQLSSSPVEAARDVLAWRMHQAGGPGVASLGEGEALAAQIGSVPALRWGPRHVVLAAAGLRADPEQFAPAFAAVVTNSSDLRTQVHGYNQTAIAQVTAAITARSGNTIPVDVVANALVRLLGIEPLSPDRVAALYADAGAPRGQVMPDSAVTYFSRAEFARNGYDPEQIAWLVNHLEHEAEGRLSLDQIADYLAVETRTEPWSGKKFDAFREQPLRGAVDPAVREAANQHSPALLARHRYSQDDVATALQNAIDASAVVVEPEALSRRVARALGTEKWTWEKLEQVRAAAPSEADLDRELIGIVQWHVGTAELLGAKFGANFEFTAVAAVVQSVWEQEGRKVPIGRIAENISRELRLGGGNRRQFDEQLAEAPSLASVSADTDAEVLRVVDMQLLREDGINLDDMARVVEQARTEWRSYAPLMALVMGVEAWTRTRFARYLAHAPELADIPPDFRPSIAAEDREWLLEQGLDPDDVIRVADRIVERTDNNVSAGFVADNIIRSFKTAAPPPSSSADGEPGPNRRLFTRQVLSDEIHASGERPAVEARTVTAVQALFDPYLLKLHKLDPEAVASVVETEAAANDMSVVQAARWIANDSGLVRSFTPLHRRQVTGARVAEVKAEADRSADLFAEIDADLREIDPASLDRAEDTAEASARATRTAWEQAQQRLTDEAANLDVERGRHADLLREIDQTPAGTLPTQDSDERLAGSAAAVERAKRLVREASDVVSATHLSWQVTDAGLAQLREARAELIDQSETVRGKAEHLMERVREGAEEASRVGADAREAAQTYRAKIDEAAQAMERLASPGLDEEQRGEAESLLSRDLDDMTERDNRIAEAAKQSEVLHDAAKELGSELREQHETLNAAIERYQTVAAATAAMAKQAAEVQLLAMSSVLTIERLKDVSSLVDAVAEYSGEDHAAVESQIREMSLVELAEAFTNRELPIQTAAGDRILVPVQVELHRPPGSAVPSTLAPIVVESSGTEDRDVDTQEASARAVLRIPLGTIEPISNSDAFARPLVWVGPAVDSRHDLDYTEINQVMEGDGGSPAIAATMTVRVGSGAEGRRPAVAILDAGLRVAHIMPVKAAEDEDTVELTPEVIDRLAENDIRLPKEITEAITAGERVRLVGLTEGTRREEHKVEFNTSQLEGVELAAGGGLAAGEMLGLVTGLMGGLNVEGGFGTHNGPFSMVYLENKVAALYDRLVYEVGGHRVAMPAHVAIRAGLPVPRHLTQSKDIEVPPEHRAPAFLVAPEEVKEVPEPKVREFAEMVSDGFALGPQGKAALWEALGGHPDAGRGELAAEKATEAMRSATAGEFAFTWVEADGRAHRVAVRIEAEVPNSFQPSSERSRTWEDNRLNLRGRVSSVNRFLRFVFGLFSFLRGKPSSWNMPSTGVSAGFNVRRTNMQGWATENARGYTAENFVEAYANARVAGVHTSWQLPNLAQSLLAGGTMIGSDVRGRRAAPTAADAQLAGLTPGDSLYPHETERAAPGDASGSPDSRSLSRPKVFRKVLRKDESGNKLPPEPQAVPSPRQGVFSERIENAVLLAVPESKLAWATKPLPASEVEERTYLGSLPDGVTFRRLEPKKVGNFAYPQTVRVSPADRAAAELSGARSLVPADGGRPDAPQHKPPWLFKTWSSPEGLKAFNEVLPDGTTTEYRYEAPPHKGSGDAVGRLVDTFDSYGAHRVDADLALSGRKQKVPEVATGGLWSRLLTEKVHTSEFGNYRLLSAQSAKNSPELYRYASQLPLMVRSRSRGYQLAVRILLSLISVMPGSAGRVLGNLLGLYNRDLGKTLLKAPGPLQALPYSGPTAVFVVDRKTTYETSSRAVNWLINSRLPGGPAISVVPNAAVIVMPLEDAISLYEADGEEVPPELLKELEKHRKEQADAQETAGAELEPHRARIKEWTDAGVTVATIVQRLRDDHDLSESVSESSVRRWIEASPVQTLLPENPEDYRSHNGTMVESSEVHGRQPLAEVERALDFLQVTDAEFRDKILQPIEEVLAEPDGHVTLSDALAGRTTEQGAVLSIVNPASKGWRRLFGFHEVVNVRISAERSDHEDETPVRRSPVMPTSMASLAFSIVLTSLTKARTMVFGGGLQVGGAHAEPRPGGGADTFGGASTGLVAVREKTKVSILDGSAKEERGVSTTQKLVARTDLKVKYTLEFSRHEKPSFLFKLVTLGLVVDKDVLPLRDGRPQGPAKKKSPPPEGGGSAAVSVPATVLGKVGLISPQAGFAPALQRPAQGPSVTVHATLPDGASPVLAAGDGLQSLAIGEYTSKAFESVLKAQLGNAPLPPGAFVADLVNDAPLRPGAVTATDLENAAAKESRYTEEGSAGRFVLDMLSRGSTVRGGMHAMAHSTDRYGAEKVVVRRGFRKSRMNVGVHAKPIPAEFTLLKKVPPEAGATLGTIDQLSKRFGEAEATAVGAAAGLRGEGMGVRAEGEGAVNPNARVIPEGNVIAEHDTHFVSDRGATNWGKRNVYNDEKYIFRGSWQYFLSVKTRHQRSVTQVDAHDDSIVMVTGDLALRLGMADLGQLWQQESVAVPAGVVVGSAPGRTGAFMHGLGQPYEPARPASQDDLTRGRNLDIGPGVTMNQVVGYLVGLPAALRPATYTFAQGVVFTEQQLRDALTNAIQLNWRGQQVRKLLDAIYPGDKVGQHTQRERAHAIAQGVINLYSKQARDLGPRLHNDLHDAIVFDLVTRGEGAALDRARNIRQDLDLPAAPKPGISRPAADPDAIEPAPPAPTPEGTEVAGERELERGREGSALHALRVLRSLVADRVGVEEDAVTDEQVGEFVRSQPGPDDVGPLLDRIQTARGLLSEVSDVDQESRRRHYVAAIGEISTLLGNPELNRDAVVGIAREIARGLGALRAESRTASDQPFAVDRGAGQEPLTSEADIYAAAGDLRRLRPDYNDLRAAQRIVSETNLFDTPVDPGYVDLDGEVGWGPFNTVSRLVAEQRANLPRGWNEPRLKRFAAELGRVLRTENPRWVVRRELEKLRGGAGPGDAAHQPPVAPAQLDPAAQRPGDEQPARRTESQADVRPLALTPDRVDSLIVELKKIEARLKSSSEPDDLEHAKKLRSEQEKGGPSWWSAQKRGLLSASVFASDVQTIASHIAAGTPLAKAVVEGTPELAGLVHNGARKVPPAGWLAVLAHAAGGSGSVAGGAGTPVEPLTFERLEGVARELGDAAEVAYLGNAKRAVLEAFKNDSELGKRLGLPESREREVVETFVAHALALNPVVLRVMAKTPEFRAAESWGNIDDWLGMSRKANRARAIAATLLDLVAKALSHEAVPGGASQISQPESGEGQEPESGGRSGASGVSGNRRKPPGPAAVEQVGPRVGSPAKLQRGDEEAGDSWVGGV